MVELIHYKTLDFKTKGINLEPCWWFFWNNIEESRLKELDRLFQEIWRADVLRVEYAKNTATNKYRKY